VLSTTHPKELPFEALIGLLEERATPVNFTQRFFPGLLASKK